MQKCEFSDIEKSLKVTLPPFLNVQNTVFLSSLGKDYGTQGSTDRTSRRFDWSDITTQKRYSTSKFQHVPLCAFMSFLQFMQKGFPLTEP